MTAAANGVDRSKYVPFMRRAIALAQKGAGRTSPNPVVGAVVVKGGRVVGEGYHRRAGGPHAEAIALRRAGPRARGATLVVTLEPCCHEGRTPPCVEAIAGAGVSRVVVGARDPNPLVDGRGIAWLRRRGIEVVAGVLGSECRAQNVHYEKYITTGRPFVTAKVAVSLDGKIAAQSGESRWISNADARRYAHELRARHDAVMVGVGTAVADDPRLTVRLPGRREAARRAIVVDTTLRVPDGLKLLKRAPGELVILTTTNAPAVRRDALRKRGHDLVVTEPAGDGRVRLREALVELGRMGVCSILVEGGGRLLSALAKEGLIDRMAVCVAPKFLGGAGLDMLPDLRIDGMDGSMGLGDVGFRAFGDNVVVEGSCG